MPVDVAVPAVVELTGARLADVVFDMTGDAAVFAGATQLLRRFGRLVLIGDTGTPADQHLTGEVITRSLQIIGAHAGTSPLDSTDQYHWTRANMVHLFYKYLERGQMRVDDLVTHRFCPRQASEAYSLLQTNRSEAMGVIFNFAQL
jgi:threonine dehydrogenase-like Zn-dependent dehydrogenase